MDTPRQAEIREPPATLRGALRYLGPGFILSASIVGSGELIATTALGAKAGFVLLWVILLSCLVKVAVQIESGRAAILHGKPTLQLWNLRAPSTPATRGLHWSIYVAVAYLLSLLLGQAGVLGGAAQVAHHALPAVPLWAWLAALALGIGALIRSGRYDPVELAAAALNAIFLAGVFYCVIAVQGTRFAFSGSDLARGLAFRLPSEHVSLAIAAFGITGVAAGEITLYPYWCLEKGYARWAGPREDTAVWRARARGWMRVMTVDALVSLLAYTTATVGFFILGATVLRAQPALRDGDALLVQLSAMFTEVLGDGTRVVFLLCAFAVLFSTVFANTAGFSRVWVDFFGLRGWLDWASPEKRRRAMGAVSWVFPLLCAVVYLAVRKPLFLVIFMGGCNTAFLAVVGWQTWRFRARLTPPEMRPARRYDLALGLSLLALVGMLLLAGRKWLENLGLG